MLRQSLLTGLSAALLLLLLLQPVASASDEEHSIQETEINHLLTMVGSSGCLFIRNGTEHEPADAESHLRMKYRNGRRYVSDAEDFINRIASKSSWTGRPYQVKCPGEPAKDSGPWLTAELNQFRGSQTP